MKRLRRVVAAAGRLGRSPRLDDVIPGEIKDDDFYKAIMETAARPGMRHLLEIGSSSGRGSTEAFVAGMAANPGSPVLHCIEISGPRYDKLVKRYRNNDAVRCYRVSSVPAEAFAPAEDVEHFLRTVDTKLREYPVDVVLGWRRQDLEYLAREDLSSHGIRSIKEQNGVDRFDAVLIDGSEFTGEAELAEVYGARFLLLDDVCTYKNYANHRALARDPAYQLVRSADTPRNGFAVYERVD